MRITKVYTRTGDKGKTSLVMGRKVSKTAPRIEAYGTVDELNSVLGMARAHLQQALPQHPEAQVLEDMLKRIQNELFNVGSELATLTEDRWDGMILSTQDDIDLLERNIDQMSADLPPLKEFILPGGGLTASALHMGRTVCRRAERLVVHLIEENPESFSFTLAYLNRLSDFLFVAARWISQVLGQPEFTWEKPKH